jgi:hypothetical protein
MKRALLLTMLSTLLFSSLAQADPHLGITGTQYKAAKGFGGPEWQSMTMYVWGMGTAYAMANAQLDASHQKLLFCQPEESFVNVPILINILDKLIANTTKYDDYPLNAILLQALLNNFPCKK